MKLARLVVALAFVLALTGTSHAWFLDFEWGVGQNYEWIQSDVPGVTFASDWFYADINSGGWNFQNNLGDSYGTGYYFIEGYVGAHGPTSGEARIDFVNQDASYFTTGYSSYYTFYVDAYDAVGNLITSSSGAANTANWGGTGVGYITVTSASNNIAYVVLHDMGYHWVADNMSGDASGVYSPSIPEPTTMTLLGLGLLGMGAGLRKRLKK